MTLPWSVLIVLVALAGGDPSSGDSSNPRVAQATDPALQREVGYKPRSVQKANSYQYIYLDTFEQMRARQARINEIRDRVRANVPTIDRFDSRRTTQRFKALLISLPSSESFLYRTVPPTTVTSK